MMPGPGAWRGLPWSVPLLLLPACVIQLLGAPAASLLRYDREAIMAGQLWRLFSGHLVHLGGLHLALNAAGLALLMVGFGEHGRPSRGIPAGAIPILMLGVGLGLLVGNPTLQWYVGLSGILHGLAVLVTVQWLTGFVRIALLAGLILKLVWEQLAGSMSGLAIGAPVIVDAHLYGALTAGILLVALPRSRQHGFDDIPGR